MDEKCLLSEIFETRKIGTIRCRLPYLNYQNDRQIWNYFSLAGVTSQNGGGGSVIAKGPDEDKIKEILNRTGYKLDVTTGQRKYGGPPPNWEGDPPASGCEVSTKVDPFLHWMFFLVCEITKTGSGKMRFFTARKVNLALKALTEIVNLC